MTPRRATAFPRDARGPLVARARTRRGTTSATFLVVDYWADPEKAVAFLPEGIEPHPDPGRCAFVAADWQSCSESGDELVDPSRSQYKEVFVVVNGLLDGEEVTVCSYIWVDRDFALTRGWIQGFPKKLGSIWITRSFGLGGPADPGMEAGRALRRDLRRVRASRRRGDRDARAPVGRRAVPQRAADRQRPPLPAARRRAPRRPGRARARPRRLPRPASRSEVWEGSATLALYGAGHEEVDALAPVRIGRGYRFTFGYTVDDLETVRELRA